MEVYPALLFLTDSFLSDLDHLDRVWLTQMWVKLLIFLSLSLSLSRSLSKKKKKFLL